MKTENCFNVYFQKTISKCVFVLSPCISGSGAHAQCAHEMITSLALIAFQSN